MYSTMERQVFDHHSHSSFSPRLTRCRSAPDEGLFENIQNELGRSHFNSVNHSDRRFHFQNSWKHAKELENTPLFIASIGSPVSKPATEIIKEIAGLELEIIHLEQYLLSLYRDAFGSQLNFSPSTTMESGSKGPTYKEVPFSPDVKFEREDCITSVEQRVQSSRSLENEFQKNCKSLSIPMAIRHRSVVSDDFIYHIMKDDPAKDTVSGSSCLADHLGLSLTKQIPDGPDEISTDIIRCMSSIYFKLANPALPQNFLLESPTSSTYSSSTFSPHDHSDNWSSECNDESGKNMYQIEEVKPFHNSYNEMLEIQEICVDDDRFNYAAAMLQNFRSLVQRLEKVDPRKMKREEQLAFWINIHNALVMHAYLAFGTQQNHLNSWSSCVKAAYNVGGHSVNAHIIRSLILGCSSRKSTLWTRNLFSSGSKLKTGRGRHIYSLERPEPLVHFALSSGAYSDPAVRAYSGKYIFQGLNLAKDEFIQANVSTHKDTKLLLPKLLSTFAKDASYGLHALVKMVLECIPDSQKKNIQQMSQKGSLEKCIQWLPYNSSFRYFLDRDLAKLPTVKNNV